MTRPTPAPLPVQINPVRKTLNVGNGTNSCGACEVDSIVGSAAGMCVTDCAAVMAQMPPSFVDPTASDTYKFDYNDINFEPSHVLLIDLKPVTMEEVQLDERDLKDSLQDWLRSEGTGLPGVHVTVFSMMPDELTSQWLSPPVLTSKKKSAQCPQVHRFRAAFVANDQQSVDELKAFVTSNDPTLQLALTMGDINAEETNICAVEATVDQKLSVPAYNSPDFLARDFSFFDDTKQKQPAPILGKTAGTIRFVDLSQPGVPVGDLHKDLVLGKGYALLLTGFPAKTSIKVTLVDTTPLLLGTPAKDPPSWKLTTDANGAAQTVWTIPSDFALGDYYLRATKFIVTNAAASLVEPIMGVSSVYTVARKARRRRLYGPMWEV